MAMAWLRGAVSGVTERLVARQLDHRRSKDRLRHDVDAFQALILASYYADASYHRPNPAPDGPVPALDMAPGARREALQGLVEAQVADLLAVMAACDSGDSSDSGTALFDAMFPSSGASGSAEASFNLVKRASSVPHPDAGIGVFVNGTAPPGAVVAFYPGIVYLPTQVASMPNYPQIDKDNEWIIVRHDGTFFDAKGWFGAGEQPSSDASPAFAARSGKGRGDSRINPLAIGHFCNHPGAGMTPNVTRVPFDFKEDVFPEPLRPFVPYRYTQTPSTFWGRGGVFMRGIALMATRELKDEELFLDYRYNTDLDLPAWYTPVETHEDGADPTADGDRAAAGADPSADGLGDTR